MRMPSTSRHAIVHAARALMPGVALTVAVWVAIFWRLGYPSFWDSDEAHYAQATREMLASGNWLVPSIDGRPFFDKPILFYLLQSLAFRALGATELAARLVSALSALGLFGSVWWLGRRFFDARVASLAVLMLALLPGTLALSAYAILDMTFTAFLFSGVSVVAVAALQDRPRLQYPGYLLLALAVLTKGPLALVLAGLAFGLALLVAPGARSRLLGLRWMLGLGVIIAVTAPWFLYMWWRFGDAFVEGYVLRENLWLYTRPLWGPADPKTFYLRVVPMGLLPWTPLLLGRGVDILRGDRWSDEERLLWVWAFVVTGFFTFSYFKLDHYVYPIVPVLCLIAAHAWQRLGGAESLRSQIGTAVGAVATAVILTASGIALLRVVPSLVVDVSRWMGLFGVMLVASGVWLLGRLFIGGFRPPPVPLGVAASLFFGYSVMLAAVLPEIERGKPAKDLGGWVAGNVPSAVVGAYRMPRWGPSWRFYADRRVETLDAPEQLREFFARHESSVCLMLKTQFDALTAAGYPLRIVRERPGRMAITGRAIFRSGQSGWETFVLAAGPHHQRKGRAQMAKGSGQI